jgi:cardiolipin synthase A/B
MNNITETIFHCGEQYFNSILQDIEGAREFIDIQIYTFSQDKLGTQIAEALIAAKKQHNVTIRLIVDGAGSPFWAGKLVKNLESHGISTKVFNPYPWSLWQWKRSSIKLPIFKHVIYLILRINSRNHRKSILIDNKIAYIGSMNIDQRHLSIKNGGQNWRDTAVRLQEINFSSMKEAFNNVWDQKTQQYKIDKILENLNSKFRLNNNIKTRFVLYKNLLKRIGKAKNKVWITNAYFIPNNLFLRCIKKSAQKGVDVRIILPNKSDVEGIKWATYIFYKKLIKSGIKIYAYEPSILHAKTIIIDNWFLVGTSNLNHRSLLHDLEIDIEIQSDSAKQKILEQYEEDFTQSKLITLSNLPKTNLIQKIVGRLFMLFKYMV